MIRLEDAVRLTTQIRMTEAHCIDVDGIMERIPHRTPFLLIDGILNCEPNDTVVAVKNLTPNEPFFLGHFPGHPVMPGVLIVEAMAQAAGVLVWESVAPDERNYILYLVSVKNTRFKELVRPGDRLMLTARLTSKRRNFWSFEAIADVAGRVAATAEFRVVTTAEFPQALGKTL